MSTVTDCLQAADATIAAGRVVVAQMLARLGESNSPRCCTGAGR